MPLQRSGSKAAFGRNVATEMKAGKPQKQALAIAYAVKRQNRYQGGMVRGYDDGGTVEPDDQPQSGLAPMSPRVEPMSRALPDYESRDPNELAMMRHREMVRPTAGRADFTPEHLANMASVAGGSFMAPEYLAARAAMAAPRLAAGVAGATAALSPSSAGEQDFKWTDPLPDRAKEMAAIQQRIDQRSAKITELGTTSTKSPAGTQKLAIDQLSALNRPDAPDVIRLNQLRADAAAERDAAFKQWEKQQEEDRLATIERKKAETSLFDKIPGTRAAMTVASPVASFLGGKYLGKRLSPYAAVPIGAAAGAVEGAGSIAGPTEIDINSLPRSSQTRQDAESDIGKGSYWQRVALAAGVSGAAGALGATKGFASTRPVMKPSAFDKPPVAAPEMPEAIQKAVQASKPKVPATEVYLPDGSVVHKYDYGNRVMWRDPVSKKLIKAPDIATMRQQSGLPSRAVHAPSTQEPPQAPYSFSESNQSVLGPGTSSHIATGAVYSESANLMQAMRAKGATDAEINAALAAQRTERAARMEDYHRRTAAARDNPFGDNLHLDYARGGRAAMNIAYAIRRQQRASGGSVHAGPINSVVPGRTDNHPMDVAEGAYVVPAETVSHLGENNTNAGMEVLNSMFGPGSDLVGDTSGDAPTQAVPINAAGGEFVIDPRVVEAIGGGDMERGHQILDSWVMGMRKKHIATLRGLPGPAKS